MGSCSNLSISEFYIILGDKVVRLYFDRAYPQVLLVFLELIVKVLGLGNKRMSVQGKDYGADH